MHPRRLVGLTPTPTDPNTTARLNQTIHRTVVQELAEPFGLVLTPAEMDACITEAATFSQGVKNSKLAFRRYAQRWLDKLAAENPQRRRYSALADWMDKDMSDRDKAMREAVAWLDNPKIAFFDTKTTGLTDEDVPVTAAACNIEGVSLLDIKFAALSDKGEVINISADAAKVNHLTDAIIATYPPLEEAEWAIISLEGLMEQHFIFAGYFCNYDRQMISRALRYAFTRVEAQAEIAIAGQGKEDLEHLAARLHALRDYYADTTHWLEVKPTLVTAIGLDPEEPEGRRTRLENIGTATRALKPGEQEQHNALADCRLIVSCIQRMKEDLEAMANEKTAKKAAAPKPAAKPNGPFPPAANPADKEPESVQAQANKPAVLEATGETHDYIAELEQIANDLQAENNKLTGDLETANARIAELEAACESYALESGGHRHGEAQTIGYLTMEVNGWPVNWTIRQGISPEQALDELFNYLKFVQLIKASDKVKTFRVSPDKWTELRPMKGFEKAAPADDPTPEGYNPDADKPAQPKGNGTSKPAAPPSQPTANKPPTPSTPKPPAPAGQPAQPAAPKSGKKMGDPEFRICNGLTRNEVNGVSSYELPFAIGGKQAEWPLKIAKNDTANFEKFLQECGWEPSTFDPGVTYSLNIRVDWERGKPVKADEPDGACFHNKSRFTLLMDQPA